MTARVRASAAEPLPPALPPALPGRPPLTDLGAVALAAAVCLGAWWHQAPPPWLAVGVVLAVVLARHPWALVAGGFVVAGALGARAWAGMQPVSPGPFSGVVTLVADPVPVASGARVDVRADGRRVELWAGGAAAGAIQRSLAGERVRVEGRLSPPRPGSPWLVPRHVVGRLAVRRAERTDAGTAPWRAANRFRRLLDRGAEGFGAVDRSLYLGFVLGDDRGQPPEVVDDFRGAGLTHLLVVSGQNVAFVLVVAGPVLERLSWRGRWAVTLAVIAAFGVVTRFEPSVLRASAMAAIAVTAGALGRPVRPVRTLALAVAALVLVDPLLVRSVAFQLSAGATFAIAVLSAPIARAVPGPRPLAEVVAVTVAAQVGVAPILIPRFGGLPVVSLVTNVLAVPVAGVITSWGLPAGAVAGLCGGQVAALAHVPTRAMVAWVATVARVGASLPLGEVGVAHLIVLVFAGVAAVWARAGPVRRLAVGVVVVTLLLPAIALRHPPASQEVGAGVVVRRGAGSTLVDAPARASILGVMEGLRRAGVRRIDVLVVHGSDPGDLVRALGHRWQIGRVEVRPSGTGGP